MGSSFLASTLWRHSQMFRLDSAWDKTYFAFWILNVESEIQQGGAREKSVIEKMIWIESISKSNMFYIKLIIKGINTLLNASCAENQLFRRHALLLNISIFQSRDLSRLNHDIIHVWVIVQQKMVLTQCGSRLLVVALLFYADFSHFSENVVRKVLWDRFRDMIQKSKFGPVIGWFQSPQNPPSPVLARARGFWWERMTLFPDQFPT